MDSGKFSNKITQLERKNVLKGGAAGRPVILGATNRDGIVLVYADWCGYCRAFKPWYNAFAEEVARQPGEAPFLGAISSTDVDAIFEDGEIQSFPTFKRVLRGRIERAEPDIDRSSPEAAFASLRRATAPSFHDQQPIIELEGRLERIDTRRVDEDEVRRLRAELAKAAALEAVYQRQLAVLEDQLTACELRAVPKKKATADKAKAKPKAKAPSKKAPAAKKLPSKRRAPKN